MKIMKKPNKTKSKWRQAMIDEFSALQNSDTWDLVPPPSDTHIVGSRWVFKVQYRADGEVER